MQCAWILLNAKVVPAVDGWIGRDAVSSEATEKYRAFAEEPWGSEAF
jgi:hypothetical protein